MATNRFRLFDQRTSDVLHRRAGLSLIIGLGLGWLLFSGVVCFVSYSKGLGNTGWIVAGGGFALLALASPFLFRILGQPDPTVLCEGCDGAGWVADLRQSHGRCPYCRGDRFSYVNYRQPASRANPLSLDGVVERGVTGAVLIERLRTHPMTHWYGKSCY